MTNAPDEKLTLYIDLLVPWAKQLRSATSWIDALKPILYLACRHCRGDVFYSLHSIVRGKDTPGGVIRFEFGGPPEFFERRTDTKDTQLDRGCIGYTLKEELPFSNFPDVHQFDGYKEANPRTNSELVVVIPRSLGTSAYGVINLESTEYSAFDPLDELFFTALAAHVSVLEEHRYALECRDLLTNRIMRALKEVSLRHQKIPELRQLFEVLAPAVRTILPADAICVVRYELMPGSVPNVEVDFDDGYDASGAWKKAFKEAKNTFSLDVARSDEPLIENVRESGDRYRMRRYRDKTKYAMGAVLRRSGGSITTLVLEFDQPRAEFSMRDREALDRIRMILVSLMEQHESAREAASLQRTLGVLRRLSDRAQSSNYLQDMLKEAASDIARSVHSSACGFYRIDKDADNNQRLRELAFYHEPGATDPNVEWGNWLNRKWEERIQHECGSQGFSDFGEALEESAARSGKRWHRVFAKRVSLFGDEPNILFLSVKAVNEQRFLTLRMDKTSLEILDAEFSLIQVVSSKEKMRRQSEAFAKSLEFALRLGFESVAFGDRDPSKPIIRELSKEEQAAAEARLVDRVHLLLEQWEPVPTSYSAVFRREGSVLVMHDATLRHLRATAVDRSGLDVPLKLPVDTPGLTSRVFKERKSYMSLRIDQEGSENCRSCWEKVTGASSSFRFFAGAPIFRPDEPNGPPIGVLTLNGRQPPHFQNMRIEARWLLLPVLEVIAAELGRGFALISGFPSEG